MRYRLWVFAAAVIGLLIAGGNVRPALAAEEVPAVTKEELKSLLDDPDLIILDVRIESHWKDSDIKIKGAIRENPGDYKAWITKYPADKSIILY